MNQTAEFSFAWSSALTPYLIGFIGSAVVEIAAFAKAVHEHNGAVPARYDSAAYLFSRIAMPFISGTIPVAFGAHTLIMAFYLGASAPVLIDKLAKGVLPDPSGKI
jgi:hypothetical protein